MSAFDLIVQGGTVVTASGFGAADIGVRDGRIAALGFGLGPATTVIDATGRLVLPGGVDSHVHLAQPSSDGAVCADDFASGTASAAVGGTTTVIPHVVPRSGESLAAATAAYAETARSARIDYAFHLVVTDPSEATLYEELPALVAAGHRSVKIFMTYPSLHVDDGAVLRVMAATRRLGALLCVHAEHHEMIQERTKELLGAGKTAPRYHADARPIVVEREAVQRIIAMAELLAAPIQIFHVSGDEPAAEIARAQARGARVWAETCTQYLTLTAADLDRPGFEGAKYICSPALRTAADQAALWHYLRRGVLSNVTSDHSPTRFDATGKKIAGDDAPFTAVPNGIPGLAARLPLLFSEGVKKGRIDLATFVALGATNAARLMGLWPRKGTIGIGSDADLAIWDPDRQVTLTNEVMQHGVDYTPYEGMTVTGWPVTTLCRGTVVCDAGRITAETGHGVFLPRGAYRPVQAPQLVT
jgi:dihydropyrimidinase